MVKSEDDPLDPDPPAGAKDSFGAMAHLDKAVIEAGDRPALQRLLRRSRRRHGQGCTQTAVPIIGNGEAVSSYIHLDDDPTATVLALEAGKPGIYNIVDDDPAPLREWLPVLAEVLGAKPPRHLPAWLARLIAGQAGVNMGTQVPGASNAKAKREMGWTLRYPSWRQGFAAAYAPTA